MLNTRTLFSLTLPLLLAGALTLAGCDQGGQESAPQGSQQEGTVTNPDEKGVGPEGVAPRGPQEGQAPERQKGPMPPTEDAADGSGGGHQDPMGDTNP